MSVRYERIIFAEGNDADEPLSILDTLGENETIRHLAQWDSGDPQELHAEPSSGEADQVYQTEILGAYYRLNWNTGLHYIGLERVIPYPD